jgi:hypothetical protein
MENVVVGAFNVLRILFADPDQPRFRLAKLFLVPFFCVLYGLFTMAHGAAVFFMFADNTAGHFHSLLPSVATVIAAVPANGVGFAVVALIVSHAVSFVWNYLHGGEFRNVPLGALMVQPFERVLVLHLVILGGGVGVVALGSPPAAVAVLVGIKTALDVDAHNRKHARLAAGPAAGPNFPTNISDEVSAAGALIGLGRYAGIAEGGVVLARPKDPAEQITPTTPSGKAAAAPPPT